MREQEGFIPVGEYRVWYRIVGGGADHENTPLLTLHGGPGIPHDYIIDMAALASETRRVVFYDQLGCGRSDQPNDPSLWTIERSVEEANARAPVDRTEMLHLVRLVRRVEVQRDDPRLAGVRVDGRGHIDVAVCPHRHVTDRPQLFGDHGRVVTDFDGGSDFADAVMVQPDGTLVVGRTRPGRGAWLCAGSDECMARAARRQSFGRALRAPVADEAVHALRNGLSEHARMELRRNTQVGED